MPNFNTSVKYFSLKNSINDMADENFPWVIKKLYVDDTLAFIRRNSTWCGTRTFVLKVAANETNIIAAKNLLSPTCSSCLTLS
jgi:hypothetical protein